jgi:hypothetical protein
VLGCEQVQFQGENELSKMFEVKECKEFIYLPKNKPLTDFVKFTAKDARELSSWFWGMHKVSFILRNDIDKTVNVFWENMAVDQEQQVLTIQPVSPPSFVCPHEGGGGACH